MDRRLGGPQSWAWRRENVWLYRDPNSNPLVIQPVTSCYIDYAILAPTLKMEATYSSKMLVDFQWTVWCYIPQDRILLLCFSDVYKTLTFHYVAPQLLHASTISQERQTSYSAPLVLPSYSICQSYTSSPTPFWLVMAANVGQHRHASGCLCIPSCQGRLIPTH
jgi:hypothetical protein